MVEGAQAHMLAAIATLKLSQLSFSHVASYPSNRIFLRNVAMNLFSLENNDIERSIDAQNLHENGLIGAAQAGHEWAFLELCERNSSRIFKTIYRVTKNREDAEDALQDSFMRAFLHLRQFDGRSSFSTWFTRIGINSAIMLLRKKRKYRETSMDTSLDGSDTWNDWDVADHSLDPEQSYAASERTMRLKQAIRRLPSPLRTVVEIRQDDSLSMREMAELTGISVPAVKSRLVRARATLRRSLSEPIPEDAARRCIQNSYCDH